MKTRLTKPSRRLSICRCFAAATSLGLFMYACDGQSAERADPSHVLMAIVKEDFDKVQQMVVEHPELVSNTDELGNSLLDYAAGSGRLDIVQLLVANHADVNARNMGHITPLHYAALNGHVDVARFLLDNHADVNAEDEYGDTPLHMVGEGGQQVKIPKELVQLLLDHGADINARDKQGETTLQYALTHGSDKDTVAVLLAEKADINAKDNTGFTALHFAAICGLEDMVELLLAHGSEIDAKDKSGRTPLDVAADPMTALPGKGRMNVLKLLLSHKAKYNAFDAAATGDLNAVEAFVEHDPDLVAIKGWHGMTLLHYAALLERKDMAEFLLAKKAQIGATDDRGETPLAGAAGLNNRA